MRIMLAPFACRQRSPPAQLRAAAQTDNLLAILSPAREGVPTKTSNWIH